MPRVMLETALLAAINLFPPVLKIHTHDIYTSVSNQSVPPNTTPSPRLLTHFVLYVLALNVCTYCMLYVLALTNCT